MKTIVILLASLACFAASAKINSGQCLTINSSIGTTMTDILVNELNIIKGELQLEKTQIVLIKETRVDEPFADYLAKQEIIENKQDDTPLSKLRAQYMAGNAKNRVIEFSYFNKQNKKSVFLASVLANDDTCLAEFNGYLIVKRDF